MVVEAEESRAEVEAHGQGESRRGEKLEGKKMELQRLGDECRAEGTEAGSQTCERRRGEIEHALTPAPTSPLVLA